MRWRRRREPWGGRCERGARYLGLLAGREVLLLLDDARDVAQVRARLPGSAGSAVLVTSRSGPADLDGPYHADLGVLPRKRGDRAADRLVRAGPCRMWM